MKWLDQNLDAYRVVAEMLNLLREAVHRTLVGLYRDAWHKKGLPESVFDRLVKAKERERSIDWYESEYQELIDYATFADFLEIVEHNREAFPYLTALAPNFALLHARFLELEVMRSKLGRAREISEPELSFLSTFHLRLLDALARAREDAPQESPQDAKDGGSDPEAEAAPGDEISEEEINIDEPAPELASETAETPAAAPQDPIPAPQTTTSSLEQALETEDTQTILRELYTEITRTADSLWSDTPLTEASAWEKVAVSNWYQKNISRLGLKPMSDFYDVVAGVRKKTQIGMSRSELQEHLKECNFAKILLALRDMFQRNNV